jgi:menaquinone-specific isochorismate synthase
MNIELMNKVFGFAQAKEILAKMIKDFAAQPAETAPAAAVVKRFELRVEKIDLLSWLTQQKTSLKIYGSDQSDNYAIAGVGQAHIVEGTGAIETPVLFKQLQSLLTPQYPYLRFYGGFCFDDENLDNEWANFGTYKFILPRFELATKEGKMLLACNIVLDPKSSTGRESLCGGVLKELTDLSYKPSDVSLSNLEPISREDIPSYEEWQNNTKDVLKAIAKNEFKKIVLARKTEFHFDQPLNPWLILRQLKKVTPYSYHFCFQYKENEVFLGASPERLYRREGRNIDSEAVAGTRPRGTTHKEDEFFRHDLVFSEKDQREHQFVVEAIETGLSRVCQKVDKDKTASVLSLQNGHHLVTEFHGELKEGVTDAPILDILHPTPAVGGAPKEAVLRVIRAIEPFSRGWYAGPIGYVGLDQTEFVVAIRSALVRDDVLTVYAGAGIVAGSNPASEWDEVENKISNFLKVLKY